MFDTRNDTGNLRSSAHRKCIGIEWCPVQDLRYEVLFDWDSRNWRFLCFHWRMSSESNRLDSYKCSIGGLWASSLLYRPKWWLNWTKRQQFQWIVRAFLCDLIISDRYIVKVQHTPNIEDAPLKLKHINFQTGLGHSRPHSSRIIGHLKKSQKIKKNIIFKLLNYLFSYLKK